MHAFRRSLKISSLPSSQTLRASSMLSSNVNLHRRWMHSNDAFFTMSKEHKEAQALCDKILVTDDHDEKIELSKELIQQMCVHCAVEEIHLYPLITKRAASNQKITAEQTYRRLLDEHQGLKTFLAELEDHLNEIKEKRKDSWPEFPKRIVEDFRKYLIEHAQEEETEFAKLKKVLEPVELANLNEKMESERQWAPLHPRPNAPNRPPFVNIADRAAGIMDRLSADK